MVSVPGPRFSLVSDSAVSEGRPAVSRVRIRFGEVSLSSTELESDSEPMESVYCQDCRHHFWSQSSQPTLAFL